LTILKRKKGSKVVCQKWTILSELILGISSSCWRYEVGAGREHIYILSNYCTTLDWKPSRVCIERPPIGLRLCFVKNWITLLPNLTNNRGTSVNASPRRTIHAGEQVCHLQFLFLGSSGGLSERFLLVQVAWDYEDIVKC
jgi:hypothetical protein